MIKYKQVRRRSTYSNKEQLNSVNSTIPPNIWGRGRGVEKNWHGSGEVQIKKIAAP